MPEELYAERHPSLFGRLKSMWPLKLFLTVALDAVFWAFYLYLSRHPFFPVHGLPSLRLDLWAGFRPRPWTVIYESIYILVAAVPWLITARDELRRYVTGFLWLSAVSFAVFAAFPVASPRPADLGDNPLLILITQFDGPLNAFPSLHAGSLVYTLCLARRLFGGRWHPVVPIGLLVWGGLILFGTLATKQHYVLDLVAGGVLGLAADRFAWRKCS